MLSFLPESSNVKSINALKIKHINIVRKKLYVVV